MKISDLFDVDYGQSLSLNKLKQTPPGEGVAFVSRTARNNGVAAWVQPVDSVTPLEAGLITVCLRSRNYALATFVQPRPFYCGYHIYVLTPKRAMTLQEKLWWAGCIQNNRYRYNFGRQANRTLAALEIPDEVPNWVTQAQIPELGNLNRGGSDSSLGAEEWPYVRIGDLFELHRGSNVTKRSMLPGETPYIGASADNNGVTARISLAPTFQGGKITVSSNGSVGEAFYQPVPFVASGDVTVLTPKFEMDEPIALFLCTLLYAEKYRWNYGRKWVPSRMKDSQIRLPVLEDGEIDWSYVRRIVDSRPMYRLITSASPSIGAQST